MERLALFASGAFLYYLSVALYDAYSGGRFAQWPALLLITFVSLFFAFTTFAWLRFRPNTRGLPSPEINLLLGPIILLPVYFALRPPVIASAEGISFWIKLIGGYEILPVLLISIQQIPMGWALDFAMIATIITGNLMRAKDQGLHSDSGEREVQR